MKRKKYWSIEELKTNRIGYTSQTFEDLNSTLNSLIEQKIKREKNEWWTVNWERKWRKVEESATLSCWGDEERPRPWMPRSASMSEFSDSVNDICSTLEQPGTNRSFNGLGETKDEGEDGRIEGWNPRFTTFRAIIIVAVFIREQARASPCSVMCPITWRQEQLAYVANQQGRYR